MQVETPEIADRRKTFFRYVFGNNEGFVALAKLMRETKEFEEAYFQWPQDESAMHSWIAQAAFGYDVYYCPQLFSRPKRNKESVEGCPCAWADLDECNPDLLLIEPTITIETSPGRWQALWMFEYMMDPAEAEDISRRIAYRHKDAGADTSGWDLTQLLRIPFTSNHKYGDLARNIPNPTVRVTKTNPKKYTYKSFEVYPVAKGYEYSEIPFPDAEDLGDLDADELLNRHRNRLLPTTWHLFSEEPDKDWSKPLWNLQMLLFEGGMSRQEVFVVCRDSACNKYRRDGRPDTLLWKEVCRSFQSYEERHKLVTRSDSFDLPLLSDEERKWSDANPTIIEEYIEWAKTVGDAAWQYHQAGGFVILSSLLAGNVKLPTSYGTVVPNLWFMILADTTLTRKTTAMDLAMDLISEIDPDAVLATDGSIEGLFTSLSMRPGRPSIFLRDEFSGLLEAITKKDYYAGMAETLTKLYDGKFQKRILRKEVIEVRDPVLILFAGGIRERTLNLLTYEHVASGFLPRFIFITAESDMTRMRPLGPPTEQTMGSRQVILDRFMKIANHYKQMQHVSINGREVLAPRTFSASLTPDAWQRYNAIEANMLATGLEAFHSDMLTPSFDRLAKSGLKAAVLIAAARKFEDTVLVEEEDLVRAFRYVETWRDYTLGVLNNIGRTTQERTIEQIRRAIFNKPGVLRSELMQNYHLSARDAAAILDTLDQRGVITRAKSGRTERVFPVGTT